MSWRGNGPPYRSPQPGPPRGGRGRSGGGGSVVQKPARANECLVPLLPFQSKVRCVQEHKVRNPHRRQFNDALTEVRAHWLDEEVGLLGKKVTECVEFTVSDAESVPEFTPEAATSTAGKVNARVFIVSGISSPATSQSSGRSCQHVLRRMDVIGASYTSGSSRQLSSYGGLVSSGDDASMVKALTELVKKQCGLDLSGVSKWTKMGEILYEGQPNTIYFFPHVWDLPAPLTLLPQVKKTTEEYTEEIEVPVEEEKAEEAKEDEEMKDEEKKVEEEPKKEDGEPTEEKKEGEKKEEKKEEKKPAEKPKPKTVKKTVTKTRTKEEKTSIPTKFTLATLHEYALAQNTSHETVELCTAIDLFDEWLKRDFTMGILSLLEEKQTEAKAKLAEKERRLKEEQQKKRKREEEETSCKKRKQEKVEELRKQWEADDVGKTDEDKKASEKQRDRILKELEDAVRKELSQISEKEKEEADKERRDKKTVSVRIQNLYDMFQYFDRPKGLVATGNTISREWLAQQILALDGGRTFGKCLELVTMHGLHPKSTSFNYGSFTTEEKVVEQKEAAQQDVEEAMQGGAEGETDQEKEEKKEEEEEAGEKDDEMKDEEEAAEGEAEANEGIDEE
ncbi:hypothetical protein DIPPA_21645 [Diplonema papillatum]|nr:hypothetical protein DIPPA_21645 [Diplonema papillatum]